MQRSLRVVAALLVLTLTVQQEVLSQEASSKSDNSVCKGVFDFYFVLDSSGSVEDHFHSEIIPFVRNITVHYAEPDFRVAIVTFATKSKVLLNLTRIADKYEWGEGSYGALVQFNIDVNGRVCGAQVQFGCYQHRHENQVEAGMRRLAEHRVRGETYLGLALSKVYNMIATLGGDRASIVLVITDGEFDDSSQAIQKSRIVRERGSTIFALGVGDVDFRQLRAITSSADQVQVGNDFSFLKQVLSKVVNDTCIEITSAIPSTVCLGSNSNHITLSGRGFTNQLVKDQAMCRFKAANGSSYTTQPTETILYDTIVCPIPANINFTSTFLLQVTTNGVSFISSDVTLSIVICNDSSTTAGPETGANISSSSSDQGLIAGVVLFLLVFLVFLFLLWYFLPLITCRVVGGLPQEQQKEPTAKSKGTPGRTWEVVDASYYGGRGAGGIRPMTVRWGEKGATLMGEKLEKAKDANVITVKRAPPRPPPLTNSKPHSTKSGCWNSTKAKVGKWYAVAASYRPVFTVHGPVRKIVWCSKSRYASKSTPTAV